METNEEKKLTLSLMIHNTPAALRFGSDGYFVTLAGTEQDKEQAAALLALNGTLLKVTFEIETVEG